MGGFFLSGRLGGTHLTAEQFSKLLTYWRTQVVAGGLTAGSGPELWADSVGRVSVV